MQTTHASDSTVNAFRKSVIDAVSQPGRFAVINFNRASLKQEGTGHFSPLAAYSAQNDQVLVMDVARYKYPAFWVDTATLFSALNTTDSSSNLSRGWFEISRNNA